MRRAIEGGATDAEPGNYYCIRWLPSCCSSQMHVRRTTRHKAAVSKALLTVPSQAWLAPLGLSVGASLVSASVEWMQYSVVDAAVITVQTVQQLRCAEGFALLTRAKGPRVAE